MFSIIKCQEAVITEVNLPCKVCMGQCCTKGAYYTKEELTELNKKYPGVFKKLKTVKGHGDTFNLTQKGVKFDEEDICVFFKNNSCSIYNDRPKICRDYGTKLYSPCGFNGLTEIPSPEEQVNLVVSAQISGVEYMLECTGNKDNILLRKQLNLI